MYATTFGCHEFQLAISLNYLQKCLPCLLNAVQGDETFFDRVDDTERTIYNNESNFKVHHSNYYSSVTESSHILEL